MLQSLSAIENCIRINITKKNNLGRQLPTNEKDNDCNFSVISSPTSSDFNLASSCNGKKSCKIISNEDFKYKDKPHIISVKSDKCTQSSLSKVSACNTSESVELSKENKQEKSNIQTKSKHSTELTHYVSDKNEKTRLTTDRQLVKPSKKTSFQLENNNTITVKEILDLCDAAVTLKNNKNKLNRELTVEGNKKIGDASANEKDVNESELCLNSESSVYLQVYPTSRAVKDEVKQRKNQRPIKPNKTDLVIKDRCFKRTQVSHCKNHNDSSVVSPKTNLNSKSSSKSPERHRSNKSLTIDDLKIKSAKELRYLLETYYKNYEANKNFSNVSSETDFSVVALNEKKKKSKSMMMNHENFNSKQVRDKRCNIRFIESCK